MPSAIFCVSLIDTQNGRSNQADEVVIGDSHLSIAKSFSAKVLCVNPLKIDPGNSFFSTGGINCPFAPRKNRLRLKGPFHQFDHRLTV